MELSHQEFERWNVLKSLLNEVIDLPPETRDLFLDQNCGRDTLLRRELNDLLSADLNVIAFLDKPILSLSGLAG